MSTKMLHNMNLFLTEASQKMFDVEKIFEEESVALQQIDLIVMKTESLQSFSQAIAEETCASNMNN